jgi:hypothetical protein
VDGVEEQVVELIARVGARWLSRKNRAMLFILERPALGDRETLPVDHGLAVVHRE